jgi:hypothetical protein
MARARPLGVYCPRGTIAVVALLTATTAGLAGCQQTVVFERAEAGTDDGGVGPSCGPHSFEGMIIPAMPQTPVVMVALDRASEMNQEFGPPGSPTKLNAARDAVRAVVESYNTVVQFGYVGFPGKAKGGCSDTCCSSVDWIYPSFGDASGFIDEFAMCDAAAMNCPIGYDRPTAAALTSCQTALAPSPTSDLHVASRTVLLITDGDPGCQGGAGDPCQYAQLLVSDLMTMSNAHTSVTVVGLGTPNTGNCLTKLAFGQNYVNPSRPNDLSSAIQTIVRQIAKGACHLLLPPSFGDPSRLHVSVNDTDFALSSTDGWTPDGRSPEGGGQIVLNGRACETFLDSGLAAPTVYACSGSGNFH